MIHDFRRRSLEVDVCSNMCEKCLDGRTQGPKHEDAIYMETRVRFMSSNDWAWQV